MSVVPQKVSVQSGKHTTSKLNLSNLHVGSTNFFRPVIPFARECVPEEKIHFENGHLLRMDPVIKPPFTSVELRQRAFFVPFRNVWSPFNEFLTMHTTPVVGYGNRLIEFCPRISLIDLWKWFSAIMTTSGASASFYDFRAGAGGTQYYLHTPASIRVYQLLRSLGYDVFVGASASQTDSYVSALPLLCYFKVKRDWFVNMQYDNSADISALDELFARQDTYIMTYDDLTLLFGSSFSWSDLQYESDFFTSVWDYPTSPSVSNTMLDPNMKDPTNTNYVITNDNELKTPVIKSSEQATIGSISQFAVTALKAFSDFQRRYQLSGGRTYERYLTEFGLMPTALKLSRSQFVGASSDSVQFGDVLNTAEDLGDYAGKGISAGTSSFDYSVQEFGMFIVVSSVIPRTSIVDGISRNVLHISPYDFYRPDFDCLGSQAVASSEVFVSKDSRYESSTPSYLKNKVFGYCPRYSEYKFQKDLLTGLFDTKAYRNDLRSWHFFRKYDENYWHQGNNFTASDIVHSPRFCTAFDSSDVFNHSFSTHLEKDHLYFVFRNDVSVVFPGSSLYQGYEFDHNGERITIDGFNSRFT